MPIEIRLSGVDNLVDEFNKLPRYPEIGNFDNHWHFALRPLLNRSSGDAVILTNTQANLLLSETIDPDHDITDILHTSVENRATAIVSYLLEIFVERYYEPEYPYNFGGPWTWCTDDAEFANAVSDKLKEIGVREEMTVVHVADEETSKFALDKWIELSGGILEPQF